MSIPVALKRRVWVRDRLYCLSKASGVRVWNSLIIKFSSISAQRAFSSAADSTDNFLATLSMTSILSFASETAPLDCKGAVSDAKERIEVIDRVARKLSVESAALEKALWADMEE